MLVYVVDEDETRIPGMPSHVRDFLEDFAGVEFTNYFFGPWIYQVVVYVLFYGIHELCCHSD
ncbi:hypothetical protein ES703_48684 [subsurface metagenome]